MLYGKLKITSALKTENVVKTNSNAEPGMLNKILGISMLAP